MYYLYLDFSIELLAIHIHVYLHLRSPHIFSTIHLKQPLSNSQVVLIVSNATSCTLHRQWTREHHYCYWTSTKDYTYYSRKAGKYTCYSTTKMCTDCKALSMRSRIEWRDVFAPGLPKNFMVFSSPHRKTLWEERVVSLRRIVRERG